MQAAFRKPDTPDSIGLIEPPGSFRSGHAPAVSDRTWPDRTRGLPRVRRPIHHHHLREFSFLKVWRKLKNGVGAADRLASPGLRYIVGRKRFAKRYFQEILLSARRELHPYPTAMGAAYGRASLVCVAPSRAVFSPARAERRRAALPSHARIAFVVLAPRRAEAGETQIIGVGFLYFFAVVDSARSRPDCCRAKKRDRRDYELQRAGADDARPGHRSVAPVFLAASATIFAATASISTSVRVFSRGWSVTATPRDFMPVGTPAPS